MNIKKKFQLKNRLKIWKDIFPKKTYSCLQARETVLNIMNHHLENANQKSKWLHICQNDYYQEDKKW